MHLRTQPSGLRARVAVQASSAYARAASWLRSERGATMAEYGLLLVMVAFAVFIILAAFGGEVLELFTGAEDDFNTLPPPPAPD